MLSEINKHERDKYISFKEEGHIYNVNGNTDYTSVTKIVKNLFEQFNPDKVINLNRLISLSTSILRFYLFLNPDLLETLSNFPKQNSS